MSRPDQPARTHSAKKHKSALRSKLRRLFVSAVFVSATAASTAVFAGGPPCNTCGPCTSQAIDKNGDGIPDGAPTASMDLNGDGIPDAAAAMAGDYYSDPTDLASSTQTLSPNMIGDLLTNAGYFDPSIGGSADIAPIPIAGGDRRFKISENTSPLPRDRVYYTLNAFQQAARTIDDREIDVYRHTLGGEKTFWGGLASFEVRMPFTQGLSAVQNVGDTFGNDAVEFGNMTLIPKFIIGEGDSYVMSAGLGINLPTARDAVINGTGDDIIIYNEAVHLSPFVGLLVLPDDITYVIGYVQADFDAGGNAVTDSTGALLYGRYNAQSLMHFDITVGRYIYQDYNTRLTGIAPQIELHYTSTMNDSDVLTTPGGTVISNPFNRLDLLTLTAGVNFEFWNTSWLTVGAAVPLRGDYQDPATGINPERPFDVELQVLFNRYF